MSNFIEDGSGNGFKAQVTEDKKLKTSGTNLTEYEAAVLDERAFNVNTENFIITGTSESATFYLKNNEEKDVYLTGIFAYSTYEVLLRCYVDPTGGSIVSTADEVDVVNRRAGGTRNFLFDAYRGFDGATISGQNPNPLLYQYQNGRSFGQPNIAVPRGGRVAISLQPSAGNTGNVTVYCGFVGYVVK